MTIYYTKYLSTQHIYLHSSHLDIGSHQPNNFPYIFHIDIGSNQPNVFTYILPTQTQLPINPSYLPTFFQHRHRYPSTQQFSLHLCTQTQVPINPTFLSTSYHIDIGTHQPNKFTYILHHRHRNPSTQHIYLHLPYRHRYPSSQHIYLHLTTINSTVYCV